MPFEVCWCSGDHAWHDWPLSQASFSAVGQAFARSMLGFSSSPTTSCLLLREPHRDGYTDIFRGYVPQASIAMREWQWRVLGYISTWCSGSGSWERKESWVASISSEMVLLKEFHTHVIHPLFLKYRINGRFCTSRCGCRALCTMGCFFESIPEVVVILDLIVCKKQSGLWSIILQHEVSPECIRTPQVLDKDNAWNFMSSMWLAVIRHSGLHKENSLYLLQNGSLSSPSR